MTTIPELKLERRSKLREASRIMRGLGSLDLSDEEFRKRTAAHDAVMHDVEEIDEQIHDAEMNEFRSKPDPRRPNEGGEARGDGRPVEPIEQSFALKPEQRMTTWAQARGADEDFGELSLGRYLRAMAKGGKTDLERRALAEGTDSAGGFTTPTILGARMIDALRAETVVSRAGAQVVPLTSDNHSFAKVLTDPTPGWRAENAAVAESDPTFGTVSFAPKSLAVMVKVSDELLEDSVNIDTALPQIMAAALAVELDRVCLLGAGSANEPLGVADHVGIGTTAVNGALSYTAITGARTGILSANGGQPTAVIGHPRDTGYLGDLADSTGQPLMPPSSIRDLPMLETTSIPIDGGVGTDESTVFVGNFSNLMIGMRSDLRVIVSRDFAVSNLQYTFVAHLRADVAVAHAASFHTLTGVGQGVV